MPQPGNVDGAAMGHVDTVEQHLPGADRVEVQNCPAQGALATAGLAHQTQGFTDSEVQRHPVHRPHPLAVEAQQAAAGRGKAHFQILDL